MYYDGKGHWTKDGWFRLDAGRLPQEFVEVQVEEEIEEANCENQDIIKSTDFYGVYNFKQNASGLDIRFSTLRIPLGDEYLSLTEHPGYLRLKGGESIFSKHEQTMAAVRMTQVHFLAEAELIFEPEHYQQMAGITLFYQTANFYYCFISREEGIGKYLQVMIRNANRMSYLCDKPIRLEEGIPVRIAARFSPNGIQFFYAQGDTEYLPVNDMTHLLPVKILSDEYATESGEQGFTGSFIGLCCQDLSGERKAADFKYLKISPYINLITTIET